MQSVITYNKNIQLWHIVYQTNIAAVTTNELKVHNKLYQTQPKGYIGLSFAAPPRIFLSKQKFTKVFVNFTK